MSNERNQNQLIINQFEEFRFKLSDSKTLPSKFLTVQDSNATIAYDGDLIVISGASKTGKSSVCAGIIAAVISPGCNDVLGMTVTRNEDDKAVIYINTEVGEMAFKTFNMSILSRSGLKELPVNFFSYDLSGKDSEELTATVYDLIKATGENFG